MHAQQIIDAIYSIKDEVIRLDTSLRRDRLLTYIDQPIEGDDIQQATAVYANVLWVMFRFHHDFGDGLKLLDRANVFFEHAGEQNQKLRFIS